MQIIDSGYGDDRPDAGLLNLDAAQTLKLIELADFNLAAHIGIVVVYNHTFLIHTDRSIIHLTDTDTAYIFIVVDRADEHLSPGFRISFGSGNIIDNSLKQRLHACARAAQIQCRDSGFGRSKNEGAVNLLVAGAQIHQKFQNLVNDLSRAGTGTVNLVDTDNDRKIQGHCLAQNETGLGHGAFKCVYDQDYAVDHLEYTLHLSAEIRVSGRINDINLRSFIINCSILTQNCNSTLPLKIIGIHDPLLDGLVFTEHTALF